MHRLKGCIGSSVTHIETKLEIQLPNNLSKGGINVVGGTVAPSLYLFVAGLSLQQIEHVRQTYRRKGHR